jgi:NADH dehydrogenase
MPYFGRGMLGLGGAGQLQPVYVEDVARAFVEAIDNPRTAGQTYDLGGSERLSWPELHETSARAITGRRRAIIAMPAWKALLLTRLVPGSLLPFNRDQVIMSQEDNTCDLSAFETDFGWRPRGFRETLGAYASRLR